MLNTFIQRVLSWPWWQRLALGLGVCAVLFALDMAKRPAVPATARAVWPTSAPTATSASPTTPAKLVLQARGLLPMPANTPSAHASNLLAMSANHPASVMAFWFAGTRESGPDVQIAQSQFDRATQAWSPARLVASRAALGEQLGFGVRRIGNPVAWLDPQGKIHLFVVATGLGGWAAGRIVHLVQSDDGSDPAKLAFSNARVLPLSWLWNISFLVRGSPLPLADGGMVLPVYFELGIKYPVALRFNAAGQFLGMTRISSRRHFLQPTLLALGETHWLALLRDQRIDGKLGVAQSHNGGQDWHDLPDLALINPDASVVALALRPDWLLLAHNSSPRSRRVLDLSQSRDGLDWTRVTSLASADAAQGVANAASAAVAEPAPPVWPAKVIEYSYPAITWADNSLWVSYTDQRRAIAWQRFGLQAVP